MSRYTLHLGDCLESLRAMADNSVDAIVTDPPYGLSDHKPTEVIECLQAWLSGKPYQPKGKGFMGKSWDAWVPGPEVWRECLRVLKPGGHLLAFAGTRSMDLMSMAVRLAGFELRDSIGYAHDGGGAPLMAWCTGQGFPKSLDVSKAIDKAAGAEREFTPVGNSVKRMIPGADQNATGSWIKDNGREYQPGVSEPATDAARQWQGWGTALKPSWEPVILARRPLQGTVAENVLAWGTGALNIDGARVPTDDNLNGGAYAKEGGRTESQSLHGGTGMNQPGKTTGAEFVQPAGRWPANLIHDGSEQVLEGFPQSSAKNGVTQGEGKGGIWSESTGRRAGPTHGDSGSAARFFYCAKASKRDRDEGLEGFEKSLRNREDYRREINTSSGKSRGDIPRANTHPTVKPTDLMRYLCRLVTPPGGVVLDPFMGSGSTGKAAMLEGFRFIGCELSPEYLAIAEARIAHALESGNSPKKTKPAHNPPTPTDPKQADLFGAA